MDASEVCRLMKPTGRCLCGNLMRGGTLVDGLCVACIRERKEKREAEQERQRLAELQTRYAVWGMGHWK